MDRCLQDIIQGNQPLGGKTVLFGGDFRQVLPVVRRAPPSVIIDTCLKRSSRWILFKQHRLSCNMRTLPDKGEFASWLLQLSNGTINNTSVQPETIEIPPQCVCEGDRIDVVYLTANHRSLHNRVILQRTNIAWKLMRGF